jgi:hypothetical protein
MRLPPSGFQFAPLPDTLEQSVHGKGLTLSMKRIRLIPLLFLVALYSSAMAAGEFSVSGRDIFLNGVEFEARGVCYQPTPIGESGGLSPFGDYYTLSTRNQALWERDFKNFRKMGVNVIRLYGWTLGADHTAFLSKAYNGGSDSIYVLVNRWISPETDWTDTTAVNALIADWQIFATELANNPAVMGFLIGNETNAKFNSAIGMVNGDSAFYWDAMKQVASAVKAIAPNKLVSVAITDRLNQVATFDANLEIFDFWAMQVYRGDSFYSLFTDYANVSSKPLMITEFGYDALDGRTDTEWADNGKVPADAMEKLFKELRDDDISMDVVAGVFVFEYADEWWKDLDAGNLNAQDFGPRWTAPFIDGQGNEEWWGIFRIANNGSDIDILEPRRLFYRIAAIWNPPFETVLKASPGGPNLAFSFHYPEHLRDQFLELKISSNLHQWTTVASNEESEFLLSSDSSVTLTSAVTGGQVQVNVQKELGLGPHELLANAGFDTGTAQGWSTGGSVVSTNPQAGSHSLELAGGGAFSVPSAFQSFPASPGEIYTLSGYLYTESTLPGDATFGILKIVFKDGNDMDLEPASILAGQPGPPAHPGAESLPLLNANSPIQQWIFSEAEAVAPPATETVQFFILNVDESPATMRFDSISTTRGDETSGTQVFFRLQNNGR